MIITGKVNMIIVNMINLDYITMAYIRFPTILLRSAETVVLSRSHWPLLQISHFRLIIMMDADGDNDYKRIIWCPDRYHTPHWNYHRRGAAKRSVNQILPLTSTFRWSHNFFELKYQHDADNDLFNEAGPGTRAICNRVQRTAWSRHHWLDHFRIVHWQHEIWHNGKEII